MIALLLVLLSAPTPVTVTDGCETPACHYLVREVEHQIQNNPATTLTELDVAVVEIIIQESPLTPDVLSPASATWIVHAPAFPYPVHVQTEPFGLHMEAVRGAAQMILRVTVGHVKAMPEG